LVNKKELLEKGVKVFKDSEQKTDDYMQLFLVVRKVLQPADGLLWSTIKEVLDEVLNEV